MFTKLIKAAGRRPLVVSYNVPLPHLSCPLFSHRKLSAEKPRELVNEQHGLELKSMFVCYS